MFVFYKTFLCYFAFVLIILCNEVSSDDIPVMLWNINGNAIQIKPASALGHNDKMFDETLKDIHRQESRILVFSPDKLSLEDFSASDKPSVINNTLHNLESFLDLQPHILLPSVKDPLNHIHKAHCGVQEIVVDNKMDEFIIQSVSSAMQRSCVVILHIPDEGIVANKEELKSAFLPSFENSNKNIVGIFTGVKSSWGTPNNDRHIFRNLLQVADENFLNFTGCIIMYAESVSVALNKSENNYTIPFNSNVDTEGSECSNSSAILQLNFKPTSTVISSVNLKLEFNNSRGAWKTVGTVTVALANGTSYEDVPLYTSSLEAPIGFSFSCGDLLLKSKNRNYDVAINIARFQVQPFNVKEVFSDSFDCVTFFTIPIWMGIFVSILFIAITNIGVYALFSVHTMDRFDDPKGKTISVAATVD